MAAFAVRRIYGSAGFAILVLGVRAGDRRQRANPRASRGAVRPCDLAFRVPAAGVAAGRPRHRRDRDRCCAADLGVLSDSDGDAYARVGWVERSETHPRPGNEVRPMMGFALRSTHHTRLRSNCARRAAWEGARTRYLPRRIVKRLQIK